MKVLVARIERAVRLAGAGKRRHSGHGVYTRKGEID